MTTTDWGSIYKELGARPVINATGSVTMLGGSTPAAEVKEAMDRAVQFSNKYVARGPYEFFPEADVVRIVQEGLAENERTYGYRYCP